MAYIETEIGTFPIEGEYCYKLKFEGSGMYHRLHAISAPASGDTLWGYSWQTDASHVKDVLVYPREGRLKIIYINEKGFKEERVFFFKKNSDALKVNLWLYMRLFSLERSIQELAYPGASWEG